MAENRIWTVMIYMAGDNNLDNHGIADLKEIKRVGSSDKVAIIAQFDRAGNNGHTKRYFLRNRAVSARASQDVVADLNETNTGSSVEFTKFIQWGMETYPAKHYLVIIWGHGTGAYDEDFYYADAQTLKSNVKRHGVFRPRRELVGPVPNFTPGDLESLNAESGRFVDVLLEIAPDDGAKDFLDNVELKDALKRVGRPIDILGMDACLMSMLEVCYQIRESVGITVSSQAEQELDGWPYEAFLRRLVDKPEMQPEELASTIIEEYGLMYEEHGSEESTLSACAIQQHEALVTAVNTLAGLLIDNLQSPDELNSIMLSRYRAWTDDLIDSVDLCDFCLLLQKTSKRQDIKNVCNQITEILLSNKFVFARRSIGADTKFSNGLGIYFPQADLSELYFNLDFVQPDGTRWGDFIREYVKAAAR
jgi:hypothetical protein